VPIEIYSPERKAEFLLNNSITPEDYKDARRTVQGLGVDPDKAPHKRPR